jgi:hypothetical protein
MATADGLGNDWRTVTTDRLQELAAGGSLGRRTKRQHQRGGSQKQGTGQHFSKIVVAAIG